MQPAVNCAARLSKRLNFQHNKNVFINWHEEINKLTVVPGCTILNKVYGKGVKDVKSER